MLILLPFCVTVLSFDLMKIDVGYLKFTLLRTILLHVWIENLVMAIASLHT